MADFDSWYGSLDVEATWILHNYVTKSSDNINHIVENGVIEVETDGLVDLQNMYGCMTLHWQQMLETILKHISLALVVWLAGRMTAHILVWTL